MINSMMREYVYGDEISTAHLWEALPTPVDGHVALWTDPWQEVNQLTSTVYDFSIADDVWEFPPRLFPGASAGKKIKASRRKVSFEALGREFTGSDSVEVVRRAKRMAWLYVHAPLGKVKSASTLADVLRKFILILRSLARARAFVYMPDDACPDGPMFFRETAQAVFERLVPDDKAMRDGVVLLDGLPDQIDDRLPYPVRTYQCVAARRAAASNREKGRHERAVRLRAVDDLNLSKLLATCDVYRRYPALLETIWEWLEKHRVRAQATNHSTGVYTASGNKMLTPQIEDAFQRELLDANWQNWLTAGVIKDRQGALVVPIYSNAGKIYGRASDLLTLRALKACTNSILFSNAIFVGFLTGARSQELYALPFEALSPNDVGASGYDHVVGRELKNNDEIDGVARDWPLPRAAVGLLESTQEIQRVRARAYGAAVPCLLFDGQQDVSKSFSKMMFQEMGYSGPQDNLVRRMRPSSAQLVSDVARSPLAVRAVLGHATVEETLGYCRGRPDDEYREMVAQRKRARDREFGQEMIAEVTGNGATDRMTRGVIKMGIDQIVALNLGDEVAVERARDLQEQILKVKPAHFSEVYELLGEDRWQIDEFIGESVEQPRPYQFCTAKKGGVHFSGACSPSADVTNPRNCKSYCPYNFEAITSLEQRADWVDKELSRGHFDDTEITTEDPIFYNSVMKILDWLWSFEGPLARFKSDLRLLNIMERVAQDDKLVPLFKGESRRTLQDLGVL